LPLSQHCIRYLKKSYKEKINNPKSVEKNKSYWKRVDMHVWIRGKKSNIRKTKRSELEHTFPLQL
jgi:hypothetical protein